MTWAQATLSALAALLATGGGSHSLAVLDVDGLAVINASEGKASGERVLRDAERRLAATFADVLTERWVGDQFVVVFPFTGSAEAVGRLRAVLVGAVAPTQYSLCAGVATSPRHGATSLQLMASAATALHHAKLLGPGRVVWADATGPEVLLSGKNGSPGVSVD